MEMTYTLQHRILYNAALMQFYTNNKHLLKYIVIMVFHKNENVSIF